MTSHRAVGTVHIVGGGPTGLTAALALARRGIDSTVYDPEPGAVRGSRASVVWPVALEVFERVGVVAEVVARGIRRAVVAPYDIRACKVVTRLDFGLVARETTQPHVLCISQDEVEAALVDKARESGHITFRRATVTSPRDFPEDDLVIAADGARSAMRSELGIALRGERRRTWLATADVECDADLEDVRFDLAAAGRSSAIRIGPHLWRVIVSVPRALARDSIAVDRHLMARIEDLFQGVYYDVPWHTTARMANLVADRIRAGNVLLAGDAAHVLSRSGGQGMNLGVVDAEWAAWAALEWARGGDTAEAALEFYGASRRRAALTAAARAETTAIGEFCAPPWARFRAIPAARLAGLSARFQRIWLRRFAMLAPAFAPPPDVYVARTIRR